MRMGCYINKKEPIKQLHSNIMSKAVDNKCNQIVLNAETNVRNTTQNGASHHRATGSRTSRQEEKVERTAKESIGSNKSRSKVRKNNSSYAHCIPPNVVNQNYLSMSRVIGASSLPPHVYNCSAQFLTPLYTSFSDVCLQQSNNYIPPIRRSECNTYRRIHTHRSTSIDTGNKTEINAIVRKVANLRQWQPLDGKYYKNSHPKEVKFSIMSFNVLAQDLLEEHQYLYHNHNPHALTWEKRWVNLAKEIKQHNADILCLQEVQESHLDTYNAEFNSLGYEGMFKKRTGIRTDGCAMYYKKSMFKLVENTTVEFNQTDVSVLNRDNVAIIARFSPIKNPKNEFVVATTHLLYNPRREDVRLAQTQVLLSEIDRLSFKKTNGTHHVHIPAILTGDFNLIPTSAVYKLITSGRLRYEHLSNKSLSQTNQTYANSTGKVLLPSSLKITDECQHADLVEVRGVDYNLSREEELKLIQLQHSDRTPIKKCAKVERKSMFSTGTLSHHLAFMSAFKHRVGKDVEATTYQDKWITVDYIFYTGQWADDIIREGQLKLISRYTIPTSQQLKGITIPNIVFGSDHLSLVAKFKLLP